MIFKNKIASVMRKRKKSPCIICRDTGLCLKTVYHLMKPVNLGKISLRTLVKFSIALKCKVADLFEKTK